MKLNEEVESQHHPPVSKSCVSQSEIINILASTCSQTLPVLLLMVRSKCPVSQLQVSVTNAPTLPSTSTFSTCPVLAKEALPELSACLCRPKRLFSNSLPCQGLGGRHVTLCYSFFFGPVFTGSIHLLLHWLHLAAWICLGFMFTSSTRVR